MIYYEMKFVNKKYLLNIVFDLYEDEKITNMQLNVIKELEENDKLFYDIEKEIVKYFKNDYNVDIDINRLFNYIEPKKIFIENNDKDAVFAILCESSIEVEHGVAIVYRNGKFDSIGMQDIIL